MPSAPFPAAGAGVVDRRRFCGRLGALVAAATHVPPARPDGARRVPILAYHRFAATALDGMTVRLDTFAAHLRVLRELGVEVVDMARLLAWQRGAAQLPPRAVVLTADDAHRSQFEHMAPLLAPTGWPVTLFVYPSAMSNASYAMTWEQLRMLRDSGRYRIESHTSWHPNFLRERARLAPDAFEAFVADQLLRSRERLQRMLDVRVSLLAWPFGLADAALCAQARDLGYQAAFTLGNRPATRADDAFLLPRVLATQALAPRALRHLLEAAFA